LQNKVFFQPTKNLAKRTSKNYFTEKLGYTKKIMYICSRFIGAFLFPISVAADF